MGVRLGVGVVACAAAAANTNATMVTIAAIADADRRCAIRRSLRGAAWPRSVGRV
jgi:hypothetical protein